MPPSDASWFNETWLGRIRDDAEDNWRLKVGGHVLGGGHACGGTLLCVFWGVVLSLQSALGSEKGEWRFWKCWFGGGLGAVSLGGHFGGHNTGADWESWFGGIQLGRGVLGKPEAGPQQCGGGILGVWGGSQLSPPHR